MTTNPKQPAVDADELDELAHTKSMIEIDALYLQVLERDNSTLRAKVAELEAERDHYKDGIDNYVTGDYINPRTSRPDPCKHDKLWYQECDQCIDEHFEKYTTPPTTNPPEISSQLVDSEGDDE